MKIFLRQIPFSGQNYEETRTAEELGLPKDIVFCISPLIIQAQFQPAGDELLGKFEVSGRYRQTCSRCMQEFEIDKTQRFEVAFHIDSGMDCIDCDDDIRQELILAEAVNPVCRDDCKGLCKNCGVNLNRETCQCKLADGV